MFIPKTPATNEYSDRQTVPELKNNSSCREQRKKIALTERYNATRIGKRLWLGNKTKIWDWNY
jgi:hypothetical protein